MKKLILAGMFVLLFAGAEAQQNKCGFEMLFKIKPGMNKLEVVDTVYKGFNISPKSTTMEKLPPYAKSGGDSIIKEILIYEGVSNSPCFHGQMTRFQLEFADNKLYKVYLSTQYAKSAYQDLISNYNDLRAVIKPKWQFERETKLAYDNIVGFGYDYSKTKKITNKTEKISLQYVDNDVNNVNGYYLLEVIWANLANTRMEGSNY